MQYTSLISYRSNNFNKAADNHFVTSLLPVNYQYRIESDEGLPGDFSAVIPSSGNSSDSRSQWVEEFEVVFGEFI